MSQQANYFKIGVFVFAALVLAAIGLIFFGADFFQEKSVLTETYFDETVQGLDRGSPVKMRGVQIGRVEKIEFVRNEYPGARDAEDQAPRWVLVRMGLRPGGLLPADEAALRETLEREADKGLRVRLSSQGLTGLTYLEMEYFPPEEASKIDVTWQPEFTYLPSAPSLMSRVTDTADEIFGSIRGEDIQRTMNNLNDLLTSLTAVLENLNIADLQQETIGLVREARGTNAELMRFMKEFSVEALTSETLAVARSARRVAAELEGSSASLLRSFNAVSKDLVSVTRRIDELLASQELNTSTQNLAATSEALRKASETLPETMEALNGTVRRVEGIIWAEQGTMEEVLENLRRISGNLAELSEEAKRNPSGVLFGEAPPRSGPTGGPR